MNGRFRQSVLFAFASAMSLCAARGEGVPEAPAHVASVQPVEQRLATRIGGLVESLGHTDPRIRDRAVEDLQRVGRAALAPLQNALRGPDPEIAARAEHLIERLRHSPDGRALRFVRDRVGQRTPILSAQNVPPSLRQISSLAPDNTYKLLMLRDVNWLTIVVACRTEHGALREEYRARDEPELRENHPGVYELYELTLRQLASDADRLWWRDGTTP